MFECVGVAVIGGVVGFVGWKGDAPERRMAVAIFAGWGVYVGLTWAVARQNGVALAASDVVVSLGMAVCAHAEADQDTRRWIGLIQLISAISIVIGGLAAALQVLGAGPIVFDVLVLNRLSSAGALAFLLLATVRGMKLAAEQRKDLALDLGQAGPRHGLELRRSLMPDQFEAVDLKWNLIGPAVTLALGCLIAAVLMTGAHEDHLKAVKIMSCVVSVTVGLCSVGVAVRLMQPAPQTARIGDESARKRETELRREALPPAPSASLQDTDTSPMEDRLTGSLKSIRDEAEKGLFASEFDRGRYLETIWAMAMCDLDEDSNLLSH
jgi:hypothetical protein